MVLSAHRVVVAFRVDTAFRRRRTEEPVVVVEHVRVSRVRLDVMRLSGYVPLCGVADVVHVGRLVDGHGEAGACAEGGGGGSEDGARVAVKYVSWGGRVETATLAFSRWDHVDRFAQALAWAGVDVGRVFKSSSSSSSSS